MDIYTVFCIVLGETTPFPVDIPKGETVGHLKDLIKAKKSHALNDIDADTLELYQVDIPDDDDLEETMENWRPEGNKPLKATKKVLNLFEGAPKDETVHFVVVRPDGSKRKRRLPEPGFSSSGFEAPDNKRQKTKHTSPGGQVGGPRHSSPLAELGPAIAERESTIEALYKRLDCYHLVLVRGTPASGKSTLAMLFERYLSNKHGVIPVVLDSWPNNDVLWRQKLTKARYNFDGHNTIIIDEAQLTYWDTSFWNGFLKPITSESPNRVILFASYGSPSGRVSAVGTPMHIPNRQRVSLQPVDHGDGIPEAGLLLNQDEFDDVIQRQISKGRFTKDFLEYVFRVTAGHAGAVTDLLKVVLAHDSYRQLKVTNEEYSLDMFQRQLPIGTLFQGLEENSIFRRGLPNLNELQNTEIARLFRVVLANNCVSEKMLEEKDKKTLEECFKWGWLHATTDEQGKFWYIFTSPLHQWFVEYYLGTSASNPTLIMDQSLPDFAVNVIRLFSRTQLISERKIGASSMQRPPEAQFQDEFYRCCHGYSKGSLITFPEFGDKKGRVDFCIPLKKWGVELLRDGDRLDEHSSRFTGSAAYAGMDFTDYILLDFRTKQPQKAHPNIPKLYHVVFEDDYNNVRILSGDTLVNMAGFVLLK